MHWPCCVRQTNIRPAARRRLPRTTRQVANPRSRKNEAVVFHAGAHVVRSCQSLRRVVCDAAYWRIAVDMSVPCVKNLLRSPVLEMQNRVYRRAHSTGRTVSIETSIRACIRNTRAAVGRLNARVAARAGVIAAPLPGGSQTWGRSGSRAWRADSPMPRQPASQRLSGHFFASPPRPFFREHVRRLRMSEVIWRPRRNASTARVSHRSRNKKSVHVKSSIKPPASPRHRREKKRRTDAAIVVHRCRWHLLEDAYGNARHMGVQGAGVADVAQLPPMPASVRARG